MDTVGIRYWDAKLKQRRIRLTTRSHLADLIAHTITRGPRVPAPVDADRSVRRTGIAAIGDGGPVFYYPPMDTFDADGNFLARAEGLPEGTTEFFLFEYTRDLLSGLAADPVAGRASFTELAAFLETEFGTDPTRIPSSAAAFSHSCQTR